LTATIHLLPAATREATAARPPTDMVTEVASCLHAHGYATVPQALLNGLPSSVASSLAAATEALAGRP
jgi:hypothetical protein